MDLRCIASVASLGCRSSQDHPRQTGPRRDGRHLGTGRRRALRDQRRAPAAPGGRRAQPGRGPAAPAPAADPAPVVAARLRRRVRRVRRSRGRAAFRPADHRAAGDRVVPAVQRGHGPPVVGPPAGLDGLGRGPGRDRGHRLVRRAVRPVRPRGGPGRVRHARAGRRVPGCLRGAPGRVRPGRRRPAPRHPAGRGRRAGRRRDSGRDHGVRARRQRRAGRRGRVLADLRPDARRPLLDAADPDRLPGRAADDHPPGHRRRHPGGQPGRGRPATGRVGPAWRPDRRHRRPGRAGRLRRAGDPGPAGHQ